LSSENVDTIISAIIVFAFVFGFLGLMIFGIHLENKHELKKLGVLKPKNKIINTNPDYNERLKYQIKSWTITIVVIIIIFTICKLFGFSIKDTINLIK